MVITLSGENSVARSAAVRHIITDFTAQYGDVAVERHDADEVSFEQLQESLQSLPFLVDRKLVVLREPGTSKQFTEHFERLVKELPETTDVLLIEPKPDKRSTYYKQLKKITDFKEFTVLDERGLAKWLVEQAKAGQGTISQTDALFMVERVGANQQLLANELEKLLLHNPAITRQTIELLTEPTPQSTIFELIEAAFAGNNKRAMQLYDEQRTLKVEAPQIVAMVAWQLHILALLVMAGNRSVDDIAKVGKLSPYVIRKNQAVAKRLSQVRIRDLVHELSDIDTRTKQAPINLDEALKNFILKLA